MTTIIVLLCIVILLLSAIIAMMVTGWPGRDRAGIDRATEALRREMAEHRSESIRLLHGIRIKVEDSVKESIEREMANYGSRGGRSRSRKAPRAVDEEVQSSPFVDAAAPDDPAPESILAARQISLFGGSDAPPSAPALRKPAPAPVRPSPPAPPAKEPEPELVRETIFVGYIDDIPDVD